MKSIVAVLALVAAAAAAPVPTPPGIPSSSSAQTSLNSLVVKPVGSSTGYSRDQFPHWSTYSGACNTREYVLYRDGEDVVQDPSTCAANSGTWYSPYDGGVWTLASDIDIDHMVPLAEAWRSGASAWTTSRRQQFANDVNIPQLWAVTDNVNQAKGDKTPDLWKPPLTSFYCTYAESWIQVKKTYALSVTSAEKSALQSMLNSC